MWRMVAGSSKEPRDTDEQATEVLPGGDENSDPSATDPEVTDTTASNPSTNDDPTETNPTTSHSVKR